MWTPLKGDTPKNVVIQPSSTGRFKHLFVVKHQDGRERNNLKVLHTQGLVFTLLKV